MFGFEFDQFAAILAILFLGGLLKGILGFGLPLLTMSLLPFVVRIEVAIALSAIVQPATNIGQLVQSGNVVRAFKDSLPVVITLAPGVVLGAWYLASADSSVITLIVGLMVVAFALYNLVGLEIVISKLWRWPVGLVMGFAAGVIGAITSINGPLFIMFLVGTGLDRVSFRSAIALIFLISGTFISSGLWFVGVLDQSTLMAGLVSLAPAFFGMWLGNIVGGKISNERFRKLILVGLLIIGISFVARTYFNF